MTFKARKDDQLRWQITFMGEPTEKECDDLVARVAASGPREIHAFGDPLPIDFIGALGNPSFPALERLVLGLGVAKPCEDDDMVVGLLSRLDAPKLTIVHVDALEDINSVIDQLATYGQTRAWKELRLGGAIDNERDFLEIIEKSTDALAGLDVLGLPIATYLSPKGVAKARALCAALRDLAELPPVPRDTSQVN